MLYGFDDLRMRRQFIEQEDSEPAYKRREHKRLDTLIAFCEAPSCRRQLLLSYFGEASEPCGNCDMCLEPPELAEGTREGQMALSAVVRTGQRFGMAHIVDILVGAETEKVADTGHDRLPTYGVGSHLGREQWRSLIRQLVAVGFLSIDIAGFGGLKLTPEGKMLLKGEREFRYRVDDAVRRTKTRTMKAPVEEAHLDEADQNLLDRLKRLRLELACERNVPAYVIFSDRSLRDMAARRPTDREAFGDVHGVGAATLRDLAEVFLAEING